MSQKLRNNPVITPGLHHPYRYLFIHFAPAIVLFDSGSTHTFLSRSFADRIGVQLEDLGFDLRVSTPAGVVLTIGVRVWGVAVAFPQRILPTDFVVMPMTEFDVIFVMDWTTRY